MQLAVEQTRVFDLSFVKQPRNVALLKQVLHESRLSTSSGYTSDELLNQSFAIFERNIHNKQYNSLDSTNISQLNKHLLTIAKELSIKPLTLQNPMNSFEDRVQQQQIDLDNHLFPKVPDTPIFQDQEEDKPIPTETIELMISQEAEKRRLDMPEPVEKTANEDGVIPLAPTTLESRVIKLEDALKLVIERIEALESRLDKLDPVSRKKLPSKKDQISDIKNNLDEWAQKFPSVDIEFELLKMLDWLQANQKRKKDYKAFFRNWLRKASNSIEKEVQDVYRYIYGCSTDKNCKHQESEYKDMVIFCNKCNSQKKIIKSVRA